MLRIGCSVSLFKSISCSNGFGLCRSAWHGCFCSCRDVFRVGKPSKGTPTLQGYPHPPRVYLALESPSTFEKWGRFWRVGTLLRSGGTLEKSPHSPKVPPLLESPPGFEKWYRFWRVGTLLRSGGTLEKSPHSPKVPHFWRVPRVLRSGIGFGEWVHS